MRQPVLVYLCAGLVAVGAITVQTPIKVVESSRGGSATLPCQYQTGSQDRAALQIWWKKKPEETVALGYLGSTNFSDEAYTDRARLSGNFLTSDASIVIDKLRIEDNGTYQCEVILPQDLQGTRAATMALLVLVVPSKPVCGIVGTAEYGQIIKVTCNSEEGSPIPTYSWKSFTPQNLERALPPTAVIDKGELTLKNISMETSGFFICTSANKMGSEFCNITLAVMPPSMNIALYAGVIGGSLAGIIAIGIIAYCCCCRDREDKEDYEMADREEEEETADHQPQQQHYPEYDNIEDDPPHNKPPVPPANKPRLVLNTVDA